MPKRSNATAKSVRSMGAAFRQLADSLDRLGSALAAAPLAAAPFGAASVAGSRTGRKLKITPARRAALKLQGQYMGYMRNLKPRQKAQVKNIKAAKGIRAAIVVAKRLSA